MQTHVICLKEVCTTKAKSKKSLLLLSALCFPLTLTAAEDDFLDSHFGVLHVYGTLTESACRLQMSSADQSINLGNIATADLKNLGDHGTLVPVSLYLHDCLRTASNPSIERNNVTWSAHQPAVSFTFTGVGDPANPQLVEARGVSGIGLRIKDADRNNIALGQKGEKLRLTPGEDTMTYYITAERTRGELRAGSFYANINFRLNYE